MSALAGTTRNIAVRISGRIDSVRLARHWLEATLLASGYPADFVSDMILAVGESLNNIVIHAYGGRPGGPIGIHLAADAREVRLTLTDTALRVPAAPPRSQPAPGDPATGGYGLQLIRSLTDEMRLERTDSGVNRLLLVKRVGSAGGPVG